MLQLGATSRMLDFARKVQFTGHPSRVGHLTPAVSTRGLALQVDAEMEDAELLYSERDCPASPEYARSAQWYSRGTEPVHAGRSH